MIEERELPEVRETSSPPTVSGERLTGYAVVFDSPSQVLRKNGRAFTEIIRKGAFKKSLETRNVTFNFKHLEFAEYGDTKSGTLKLWEDERGMPFELTLPVYAHTLKEQVVSGSFGGMSFGMKVNKEEYINGVRNIIEADLFHISPVYEPAYPQTNVELKSPSFDTKKKRLDLLKKF